MTTTEVGELACQKDSYLRELDAEVIECTPKKKKFEVVLSDTIIFPTGGGQPNDLGVFECESGEKVKVLGCERAGNRAVHLVDKPFKVGDKVHITLDWARRFDHMQQHSGQHLLSALLDKMDCETLSWNMAPMAEDGINYVEIPRALTDQEIDKLQEDLYECIRAQHKMTTRYVDDQSELSTAKIPDDFKGKLRIVSIENGIDEGLCCGTHVAHLGHVSTVILLRKQLLGSRGAQKRVQFICGDARVGLHFLRYNTLLKATSTLLSCNMEAVPDRVTTIQNNLKAATQKGKRLAEALAARDVEGLDVEGPTQVVHREDNDTDYVVAFTRQCPDPVQQHSVFAFLAQPTDKGPNEPGMLFIKGAEAARVGAKVSAALGMRGGGKGNYWQGKTVARDAEAIKNLVLREVGDDPASCQ